MQVQHSSFNKIRGKEIASQIYRAMDALVLHNQVRNGQVTLNESAQGHFHCWDNSWVSLKRNVFLYRKYTIKRHRGRAKPALRYA